jgi:hypothetical protein
MILSRTKASHQEVQAYPVKNFNSYSIVSAKGLFFAGGISHNGPAIKAVSVAERMKAGAESPHRVRVPVPAVMSEAWRGFCRPVASFLNITCFAVQC